MSAAIVLASLPGCTSDPDDDPVRDDRSSPAGQPAQTGQPGQTASTTPPPGTPTTAGEALALARAALPEPEDYGDAFTRQDPYETGPASWPVLGDDCVWRRRPLPADALVSLARNVEAPARQPGAPPFQVTSSVTVFDSVEAADARMAEVLEEALRCPGQEVRPGEFVYALTSGTPYSTTLRGDDAVYESGQFTTGSDPDPDTGPGPFPYLWTVTRYGTVVTAVAVKGTEGYADAEVDDVNINATAQMGAAIEEELAR